MNGPVQGEVVHATDPTPASEPFRFVVVGDQGSGNKFRQLFGKHLERLHEFKPFSTMLLVGDNVYGSAKDGVNERDGDPALFKDRIWTSFKSLIRKGVQMFPILGNHDVRYGQEEAQLKYWNTPRYYNFKRGNVEFFALDTTTMLPNYDKCYSDRVDFAHKMTQEQLDWLDKKLGESKAKYKVVMGHYPMYTSGKYLNRGVNAELIRNLLQPLLVKHGVDIYLCGHEHHYERSKPIYGVTQFLTGSASKLTKDIAHTQDPPYPRAHLAQQHQFMVFEERPEGLAFNAVNDKGEIIDSGVVPARTQPNVDTDETSSGKGGATRSPLAFLKQATAFLNRPEAEAQETPKAS